MLFSWGVVCSIQKPFTHAGKQLCEKTVEEMAGVKGQLNARGLGGEMGHLCFSEGFGV